MEATTRLNPWVVEYWLDLALATMVGDGDGEASAFGTSFQAEPKNLKRSTFEGISS